MFDEDFPDSGKSSSNIIFALPSAKKSTKNRKNGLNTKGQVDEPSTMIAFAYAITLWQLSQLPLILFQLLCKMMNIEVIAMMMSSLEAQP